MVVGGKEKVTYEWLENKKEGEHCKQKLKTCYPQGVDNYVDSYDFEIQLTTKGGDKLDIVMTVEIEDCDILAKMGFEEKVELQDKDGKKNDKFKPGDKVFAKITITKHYAPIKNIKITSMKFIFFFIQFIFILCNFVDLL